MSTTISNEASDEPIARYNHTAITLHWLVAALIVINVCYGLAGAYADDAHVRPIVDMHKSIGLTVLGLVLLRILWRLSHKPPAMPAHYPRHERLGAHLAHATLYLVILLLPLSGYLHDSAWNGAATHPLILYGFLHLPRMPIIKSFDPATKDTLHTIFGAAHIYIGYVLYALVGLHLAGVAKHHIFDRESEISRMLPAGYRRPRASGTASKTT